MAATKARGIIDISTNRSVDETVAKLKGILESKGVTLFALVDHSGQAEKVKMKMRPTKLLIFGRNISPGILGRTYAAARTSH